MLLFGSLGFYLNMSDRSPSCEVVGDVNVKQQPRFVSTYRPPPSA